LCTGSLLSRFPCASVALIRRLAGTGYTISSGTTPKPFTARVIGVLKDGIAPGLDMIIVETDSPAIRDAGGIWAGMSGSPVYTSDGRLLGAVAYGLSGAPSRIGGITPAEEMLKSFASRPRRTSSCLRGFASRSPFSSESRAPARPPWPRRQAA
jgi:SpoIVB peptidase S55